MVYEGNSLLLDKQDETEISVADRLFWLHWKHFNTQCKWSIYQLLKYDLGGGGVRM
jgi:hypothetical protein